MDSPWGVAVSAWEHSDDESRLKARVTGYDFAVVGPTAGGHRAGSGCASGTGLVNEVRNKGMMA
jgi:NAD(P)H-dependent flavin oxidoreductase YrpB (nitropropane dioxygenase family)